MELLIHSKAELKYDADLGRNMGVCFSVRLFPVSTARFSEDCANLSIRIVGLSLLNGGTAGGIWMFLVVCVGMFHVVLSLAEMASMYVSLPSPSSFLENVVDLGWATAGNMRQHLGTIRIVRKKRLPYCKLYIRIPLSVRFGFVSLLSQLARSLPQSPRPFSNLSLTSVCEGHQLQVIISVRHQKFQSTDYF